MQRIGQHQKKTATLVEYRFNGQTWELHGNVFPASDFHDYQPALSPDGDKLLFTSTRPIDGSRQPARQNIWLAAKRPDGTWASPQLIQGLESPAWDGHAVLTADGTLYFASERDGGAGLVDIYQALLNSPQDPLQPLTVLNSALSESDFYISPDQKLIIFTRYDPETSDLDLHYAVQSEGQWTAPKPIDNVNTDEWQLSPVVTPDHKHLVYLNGQDGQFLAIQLCSIFDNQPELTASCQ